MSASGDAMGADLYMGDWTGSTSIGGETRTVGVYMIPLGDSRYEARFVESFDRRGPWLQRLKGEIRAGQFRFMDDISFDVGRVVGAAENGVILDAALWLGKLGNDGVSGTVAGRHKGSFQLKQSGRISPELGKPAVRGAVVLFNGTSLSQWQHCEAGKEVKWKVLPEGVMEVNGGNIVSREVFGDHRLHLEFRLPYMPAAFGQGRANSGVYLQGRYEVQVLDSYGLEGADNECGGIYQVARPRVNMCAPPLQWQSYDIEFRQAKLDGDGRKVANARITVNHNGVMIHDNIELPNVTGGALTDKEGRPGGLMLQDHGNPVQFRNIWVQRLD